MKRARGSHPALDVVIPVYRKGLAYSNQEVCDPIPQCKGLYIMTATSDYAFISLGNTADMVVEGANDNDWMLICCEAYDSMPQDKHYLFTNKHVTDLSPNLKALVGDTYKYYAVQGRHYEGASVNDCRNFAFQCLRGKGVMEFAQRLNAGTDFEAISQPAGSLLPPKYYILTTGGRKPFSVPHHEDPMYLKLSDKKKLTHNERKLRELAADRPLYDEIQHQLGPSGGLERNPAMLPDGYAGCVLHLTPTLPEVVLDGSWTVLKEPLCNYHALYVLFHNTKRGYMVCVEANAYQENLTRVQLTIFTDGTRGCIGSSMYRRDMEGYTISVSRGDTVINTTPVLSVIVSE